MIKLYYHVTGSDNHGCEAIVRSTTGLFDEPLKLYSYDKDADLAYHLDRIIDISRDEITTVKKHSITWLMSAISHKIHHDDYSFTMKARNAFFADVHKGDLYLSIGGDNYCYQGQDILGYYNRGIHKKGGKTVLWGCSIQPDMITEDIKKDLALYDLIVAREHISYEYLKSINSKTIYACDPAFVLRNQEISFPNNFLIKKTVGINASPLIERREKCHGITYHNYVNLINYITNNTEYNVALIPHVVQEKNDDRIILNRLFLDPEIDNKERICMIKDCNCMQLKYLISKLSLFVGARTHATIAAYSSFVPTLVVGYSTKAIGIARDLFGTDENYVYPVQGLNEPMQLVKAFCWLDANKEDIKQHLLKTIPEYTQSIYKAVEMVKRLS